MRPPPTAHPPVIERHEELLDAFLSDAAHVGGGFADGVIFPRDAGEVAASVAAARRVLPIGAQSSLTGGATPRGELLLSTRRLAAIAILPDGLVRAGAGVPLKELQLTLAAEGRYYPPAPTFDGAFIGGTIATNAAGAATFKYGSTRRWVQALTIVLADGGILELTRGQAAASADRRFELQYASGALVPIPLPTYAMPDVPKLSAGYFARPGMDAIDLFVGSEGTLGVIVEATVRTVALPRRAVVLVVCTSDEQAIAVTGALREEARASWRGAGPLDVSAVEFMDARSLSVLPSEAFSRAGIGVPQRAALLVVQVEMPSEESPALQRLGDLLGRCGVEHDPLIALPGDDRTASRFFELREAVPAAVNQRIAAAQASVDRRIEKTAGDFIVPFDRIGDALRLYREVFERYRLRYAIWGHLSDGNLHPNVIPESADEMERGREALRELGRAVVELGGAPLAEHGVGRSALKQQMLRDLYGDCGIDEMRAVKRALDPAWKLSPGVLFPEPSSFGRRGRAEARPRRA